MNRPKLAASHVKHVWAGAVIVATTLVVAGCEFPRAEQIATPATFTPAARALASPPPAVGPVATARGAALDAVATVPAAATARAFATIRVATLDAVATARAVAIARAAATATAVATRTVTVDINGGRTPCVSGFGLMLQYARWTTDGAHILFTYNRPYSEVWAVTADGSRVWRVAQAWGQTEPRSGEYVRVRFGPMTSFDVTPDGQHVVYATCRYPPDVPGVRLEQLRYYDFDYELAVVGLDGQTSRRLTRYEAFDNYPAWSPDGTRVAFVSNRDASDVEAHWRAGLYTMAADGTDVRHLETGETSVAWQPPAWSPDGRSIAVAAGSWKFGVGEHALYVVPADGAGVVRLSAAVSGGAWSPDGTRLAFAQPEGAGVALYTIAADGADARRVTTVRGWERSAGGPDLTRAWIHTVAWSPDGAKLLYPCGPRQFCVVTLDGEQVGEPCQGMARGPVCYSRDGRQRVGTSLVGDHAVWSPDGQRIAVAATQDRATGLILYSAAPDGSDVRPLAFAYNVGRIRRGEGPLLVAAQARDEDPATSSAACAGGFVVPTPAANPGLVRDCETLIAARTALFYGRWVNWGSGSPLEFWEGVIVAGASPRVVGLELTGLDVAGSILPALGNLDQLRRLDLPGNRLTGPFPEELVQLWNLERLGLSNNHLTGGIPAELGQLRNLERLRLAGNHLTGCIPVGLQRVPDHDLTELNLPECEAGS